MAKGAWSKLAALCACTVAAAALSSCGVVAKKEPQAQAAATAEDGAVLRAVTVVDGDSLTLEGQTLYAEEADQSVLVVKNGGSVVLRNCTITKMGSTADSASATEGINAALVALGVGKLGAEPGVDDLEREHLARDAGANGHHVGVVMFACQAGRHQVAEQRAADSLDLVGGDGDADAGRAGEDAHVTFAGGNSFRRRRGKVGIVAAGLVEAAKILDLIALFRQMGFDGFLQVVCAVVAGKSDFHVGFSFVVMVFCYIISGAQRFCKRQPRKICQKIPMRRDQSFAYASSLTGSHHSFLHSVPGTSTAMWLNQLSHFAPCQCLTLAGIVMTVPGWRLTAGCPSS